MPAVFGRQADGGRDLVVHFDPCCHLHSPRRNRVVSVSGVSC